ncbi:MAG: hypothetical protein ACRC62_27075 [Microcoleus sp.]
MNPGSIAPNIIIVFHVAKRYELKHKSYLNDRLSTINRSRAGTLALQLSTLKRGWR